MKTRFFLTCMGVLWLISARCFAQTGDFTINGKLENISPTPGKMYLKSLVKGLLSKDLDSVAVKNGEYHFQGKINVDEAVVVSISPSVKAETSNTYNLYVDKGELNVISSGSITNIKVAGSGATAQHEHDDILNGVKKEREDLQNIVKTEDYKTNQELQVSVAKRASALTFKGLNDTYEFVKNNPTRRSVPITTYALILSGMLSREKQDSLFQNLPQHVKTDALGAAILREQQKADSLKNAAITAKMQEAGKVTVGSQAPDFMQPDINNKPVRLSSFKGKYVLVDFWASWCAPCRAENPNVAMAFKEFAGKGFTVLGVSLDSESGKIAWKKAVEHDQLLWTQVSDLKGWKNAAAEQYGVSAIPQNFLIGPDGKVIGKNLRGKDLIDKLKSIFNSK